MENLPQRFCHAYWYETRDSGFGDLQYAQLESDIDREAFPNF